MDKGAVIVRRPRMLLDIVWWDDDTLKSVHGGRLYHLRDQYGFFFRPQEIDDFYVHTPTIVILTKNTSQWDTPLVLAHEIIHYIIWLMLGYSYWKLFRSWRNDRRTENRLEQFAQFIHEIIWKGPKLAWDGEKQRIRQAKRRKAFERAFERGEIDLEQWATGQIDVNL